MTSTVAPGAGNVTRTRRIRAGDGGVVTTGAGSSRHRHDGPVASGRLHMLREGRAGATSCAGFDYWCRCRIDRRRWDRVGGNPRYVDSDHYGVLREVGYV